MGTRVLGVAANWGVYMPTHLHLASRWIMSDAYFWSPICLHDMDRNNFTFPTFLSSIYIYRQMLYSVDCAQILYFCNARCRSAQNMALIMWWRWWQWWAGGGGERIPKNSYFWISLQNPPLVTVQRYFCTLSHSQQFVQAATQHVKSNLQKSVCMSFHWKGETVTVVKHKMWHCVGKGEQ